MHLIIGILLLIITINAKGQDTLEIPKCFNIKTIEIQGINILPKNKFLRLKKKYSGHCLTVENIKNIIREITNVVIEEGYLTTQVTLPEQDLSNGKLIIQIDTGYIEDIEYDNLAHVGYDNIFPAVKQKILNLRDLEQGLDQLNRLKSNKATIQIKPGTKPGSSIIVVENKPLKKWGILTGIDNSGDKYKGPIQTFITASLDDVLGFKELYIVGYRQSIDNPKKHFIKSYSGVISVPYGYHNLTLSYDRSIYRTYIQAARNKYRNAGGSHVVRIGGDTIIHRDGMSKTILSSGLQHDNYSNYLEEYPIAISTYRINKFEIGSLHQRRLKNSIIALGLRYFQGVNENYIGESEHLKVPNKRFHKTNYHISLLQPLPFSFTKITPKLNIELQGQITPDILCGSEKINIGGPSSVRGFKQNTQNTDNGFYIRNELILDLPTLYSQSFQSLLGNSQIFLGYDLGQFRSEEEISMYKGTLSGVAAGVRGSEGKLKFNATIAKGIKSKFKQRNNLQFYFSAALEI